MAAIEDIPIYGIGCLTKGCNRAGVHRGNCLYHYHVLRKQVKAGTTTWAKLQKRGKATPIEDRKTRSNKLFDELRARRS